MYEIFLQLLARDNVTVADVSRATGIQQSTLSNWKTRRNLISGENAILIAEFFNVSLDYLLTGKDNEKKSDTGHEYYFSDDTAAMAQELFENKNMRILFDAARDSKPEDLQMVATMLQKMKGTNPNG